MKRWTFNIEKLVREHYSVEVDAEERPALSAVEALAENPYSVQVERTVTLLTKSEEL